jgi:hypothetical protein
MTAIGFAKMNAKGQLLIPASMKDYFTKGEKLFLLKNKNRFILRKMNLKKDQDLDFAYETEEAWERIEKGKAIQLDFDDFLSQLSKW